MWTDEDHQIMVMFNRIEKKMQEHDERFDRLAMIMGAQFKETMEHFKQLHELRYTAS